MNQKYHISRQEDTSLLSNWTKNLNQSIHFGGSKLAPVWSEVGPKGKLWMSYLESAHFGPKLRIWQVVQKFIKRVSKILVINNPLKQGLTRPFQMIKLIK